MEKFVVKKEYILFKELKTKVQNTFSGNIEILSYQFDGTYIRTSSYNLPLDTKFYVIRYNKKFKGDKGISWGIGYIYYGEVRFEINLTPKEYIDYEKDYQRLSKIEKITSLKK